MGGRAVGLGMVVVAVIAAIVIPLRAGHRIAGTATASALPPMPQVGDCVQAVVPEAESSALQVTEVVPCTQPHLGQVITRSVANAVGSGGPGSSGGVRTPRPNLAACATTAYGFLGVHPVDADGERSPVLGPWWPAFAVSFHSLSPGPLRSTAGPSWQGCVMTGFHGLYSGEAARLFAGPPRRNPVALCIPASTLSLHVSVSCERPHPTEILGWRVADAAIDPVITFGASCGELAHRITGMADPTAGGTLRIAVIAVPSPDGEVREGWGPGHSGPYRAACTIGTASTRMLGGSVTGLGASPVPWA